MNQSKAVLITGASSGLGLELLSLTISAGYRVYSVSRRPINQINQRHTHICCDLTNDDQLLSLVNLIDEPLDIIIHSAGCYKGSTVFFRTEYEEIDQIIDLNLKVPCKVTHLLQSRLQRDSVLVFINSVAGIRTLLGEAVYSASKHGLRAFTQILRQENSKDSLRVISLHPGGINTPMQSNNPDKNLLLDPSILAKRILSLITSSEYISEVTLYTDFNVF